MCMPGTVRVMNQSKPFGSAGPHPSTPAKAAAPAGPTGIAGKPPGKPLNAPPTRPAAVTTPKAGTTAPAAVRESARPGHTQPQGKTGKVVHDERGNAMWDWLKQTGRNAIESTTRMLRRLETPELTVEETHEEELRIQPDNGSAGGGYDPYNQPIKSRRTPSK